MSGLPPEYLVYPKRRRGLDHDHFAHRNLAEAPCVAWPGGARVALWIAMPVQHFPMDMAMKPVAVPGGMERPYPSYWDYTQRDYGLRIGIYRLLDALAPHGLAATAFTSGVLAARTPVLLRHLREAGCEIAAGGLDMGHVHHAGVPEAEERRWIAETCARLADGGAAPTGWHSPAHSQSPRTMALLAEAGFRYVADWVNDDLPYPVTTPAGGLLAMPMGWDLSDQRVLHQQHMATEEFCAQVLAAHAALRAEAEATGGGRILCLTLTPWVMGQPHRVRALRGLLAALVAEGVWNATGAEIAARWPANA